MKTIKAEFAVSKAATKDISGRLENATEEATLAAQEDAPEEKPADVD